VILCGILLQIAQLVRSIRQRHKQRREADDPWDGRTLEWSTRSPPPAFNFAVLPQVTDREPHWQAKQHASRGRKTTPRYRDLQLPRNSPTGFITAFFAVVTGFALIWHIWWLTGLGLLGAYATFVRFAWRDESETHLPAQEVARLVRRDALRAGRTEPQDD
jgi:cytochrome o ubiquinol oxidase subunit I